MQRASILSSGCQHKAKHRQRYLQDHDLQLEALKHRIFIPAGLSSIWHPRKAVRLLCVHQWPAGDGLKPQPLVSAALGLYQGGLSRLQPPCHFSMGSFCIYPTNHLLLSQACATWEIRNIRGFLFVPLSWAQLSHGHWHPLTDSLYIPVSNTQFCHNTEF